MSFTSDLNQFCRVATPAAMDRVVRSIVIEAGTRVVLRSPVGDPTKWGSSFIESATALGWIGAGYVGGRFRGNWQYSLNQKPEGTLDDFDKSGGKSIGRITAAMLTTDTAGVHYLGNNLPYAKRLEEGYSSQAPQGMVALTQLEFNQIFQLAKAGTGF